MELGARLRNMAVLVVVASAVLPAMADDKRWYVGIGAGQATTDSALFEGRSPPVAMVPESLQISSDKNDAMGRIAVGYRFSDYISVEAMYANYGRSRIDLTFEAQRNGTLTESGTMGTTRKVDGFGADAVFSVPVVDRFKLLGRVGWFSGTTRAEITTNLENTIASGPFFSDRQGGLSRSVRSRNGTPKVGAGVEWSGSPSLSVRLEWEHLDAFGQGFSTFGTDFRHRPLVAADAATGRASMDAWSASILWRF